MPQGAAPGRSSEYCDFLERCFQMDPQKRASAADLMVHPLVRRAIRRVSARPACACGVAERGPCRCRAPADERAAAAVRQGPPAHQAGARRAEPAGAAAAGAVPAAGAAAAPAPRPPAAPAPPIAWRTAACVLS
jgi:hypothetical protein